MTEPRTMTADEAAEFTATLLVALVDDDVPRVHALFASLEPCRGNFILLLYGLPSTARIVLQRLHPGAKFAAPHIRDGADEAEVWAARIIATALNNDEDTNHALVKALLDRADKHPDQTEAGKLVARVILSMVSALRSLVQQLIPGPAA